jgi:hypothetical protein
MKKGIALSEMLLTIAIISGITIIGLVVYRTLLFTLSLNIEAELIHNYLKKAQTTAEVYERIIKWETKDNSYIILDIEDDVILKEKNVPNHITMEGGPVIFNKQIRPEQGETIFIKTSKKTRKITIDPSTGRIKLW